MNLMESLRIALRALNANKVRSALTMLGVIIGVAAVILLVAIGTGVQDEVTGSIEGLGSNLMFVFPGDLEGGGGPGGPGISITKPFTAEEADLLDRRLSDEDIVVPIVQGQVTLKSGNRTIRSTVSAGNEYSSEVFSSTIVDGRYYRRSEVVAGSRVVILGSRARDDLFPGRNPVGEPISIEGQRFTVIGYVEALGGSLTGDQDSQIYMPYTAAQKLLGTQDISSIVVQAGTSERVDAVKAQVERVLRPVYGDQFTVFTQEQTLGIFQELLGTLTVMLAGIAGISLLVGGIGIMNIMLVSVSERTREIGIRKAVGARTYDILSQFVIEAIMLSVLGGVIGIAVGAGGAFALSGLVPTQVTGWAVATAFFFAAGVGIFFGVYPALKASRLDPIEALRYE